MRNETQVPEFILLGLTNIPELQPFAFGVLFMAYTITIMGNIIIISITFTDYRLRTPMYFFLRNLSFIDVCIITLIVPRMLTDLRAQKRTISLHACLLQYFCFMFFGAVEFTLLAVMSFDRYVAICYPLRYTTIMSQRLCSLLVISCWTGTIFLPIMPIFLMSQLSYCKSNVIDHFFCDYTPLMKISCGDKQFLELVHFLVAFCTVLCTLLLISVSYTYILITIMQIPSAKARQRAFSTCSSHLIVITICYGSIILMYIRPTQKEDPDLNKGLTILMIVFAPLMNPFIYTLRNQQVKDALRDAARKTLI
ncbi:olfactory receptor 6C4-like [Carettochelys insculpta]|uniref:olfactory receptor 6C4-like n=1 Tax=Carettochelys insculpta TaxID=44489 RepID=UPI003EBB2183